jgi:protein-tyrosine-phosphatase
MVDLMSSRDKPSGVLCAGRDEARIPARARSGQSPLVLFLCRQNTATSIMAEAILRQLAQERFRAASAGESVAGGVNSHALECLREHGIATNGLQSKAWGEFFGLDRPPVRFVITLCNVYAARVNWSQDTLVANWPMSDPAELAGSDIDIQLAFEEAYTTLGTRIQKFLSLRFVQLDDRALLQVLERIGEGS